jgi:hypothetical protein
MNRALGKRFAVSFVSVAALSEAGAFAVRQSICRFSAQTLERN